MRSSRFIFFAFSVFFFYGIFDPKVKKKRRKFVKFCGFELFFFLFTFFFLENLVDVSCKEFVLNYLPFFLFLFWLHLMNLELALLLVTTFLLSRLFFCCSFSRNKDY